MVTKYMLIFVAAIASAALVACATTPEATELSAVMQDPAQFENEYIEFTAPVAENRVPEGEKYQMWSFVVDSCEHGMLTVVEEGFNPARIEEGYYLVEKARREGDPVTVSGTIERTDSGLKMELTSVRYGDTVVHTDTGPFVPTETGDDAYPGTPYYYDGNLYYAGEFPAEKYDIQKGPDAQLARSVCPME
ncbi:MAG: hypothetical protein Kow0099_25420 [Candidatus Abyssubacteria bacterium]